MIDEEKIAIKLKHQFDLIWETLKSLEYLINFPKYLKFTGNDKPKDLWFIYLVIRNNTVLNLNKLFNPKEHYSFDKIKRLLIKDFDKTDDRTKVVLLRLKEAKKLYEKLELQNIRNKHVGHLDENRTEKNLNWEEVKSLTLLSCEIHDKINLIVFNQQSAWIINEKVLNSIFTNDLRSIKLFELRREMFRENYDTTDREKILELTKINWP